MDIPRLSGTASANAIWPNRVIPLVRAAFPLHERRTTAHLVRDMAGRIWSTSRAEQGWRAYTGGGVHDSSDPTGGHYDHIHVSVAQ
jgi:hypothetical protein